MISQAKLRYLRISPRKVRLVADLVRGETVERAQTILGFTQKRAALPILKLLKQCVANAKNNLQVDEKNLYISQILVDEGIKLKRYLPRARGKADVIHKKTSHITLVLDEVTKKAVKKGKKNAKIKRVPKVKSSKKKKREKPSAAKTTEGKEEKPKKEETLKKDIDIRAKKLQQRRERRKVKTKKQKFLKRFFRRKAI